MDENSLHIRLPPSMIMKSGNESLQHGAITCITQHFFRFVSQAKAIFKEVLDAKPDLINKDFL